MSIDLLLVAGCSVGALGILGAVCFALKKPKRPPPDLSKYEARDPAGSRFGPSAGWDNSPREDPKPQEMSPELKEWMRRNQPPKR